MPALQYLSLAVNPFSPARIPAAFGKLTKLNFLWISEANLIGEIPVELGNLKDLTLLQLSSNQLSGPVPKEIWALNKLKYLYLYYNELSGEISGIASGQLIEVDLSMNNFTGQIPPEFGRNPYLQLLFLYRNQLSGKIPPSIGLIPAMQDLRLFENNLTGEIPESMGNFSKLKNLELWQNEFSGEIPGGICAGGELESLVLHNNNFNGSLPKLGSCFKLQTLRLSGNCFSGEVPPGIWTLKNLTTVILGKNNFSGELPEAFPATLSRLEIEENSFSGKIPKSAPALKVFSASSNNLSGKIFSNFSNLTLLQELRLDNNQISGEIPPGIEALKALTFLNLSSNLLSGEIPREIKFLPVLTSLDLSNNQLSGEIPWEMGSLKLNFLNLSGNFLSGEIPLPFQNQAYSGSFLSNPNLCSSTPFLNLPSCSEKPGKSALSKTLLSIFLSLGILFFLGTVLLIFLLFRNRSQTKKDEGLYKLTSFHSLSFSESQIIKGIAAGSLVGGGGSGDVYKVQVNSTTAVAVKRIRRDPRGGPPKEFDAEVKILSSIRHANIVKLLCCIAGEEENLLVYEFMENGSLDQWVHGESPVLTWPARLSAVAGAARGICYMHEDCSQSIIHRDIKSSNVLLDGDFHARVSDFGISRIMAGSHLSTSVAGSPGYMAPELAYGGKVSEKVDVYAFGVVLLEITTGRMAFDGGDGTSSLVDWAWKRLQDGEPVMGGLDRRIVEERNVEEMEVVYRLGIACTEAMAGERPTMRKVLQVLLRCEQKCEEKEEEDGSPTPLLREATKSRSRGKEQNEGHIIGYI